MIGKKMSSRENYLRNMSFNNPEWIPVDIAFGLALWHQYREDLENLLLKHPRIFENFKKGSVDFDHFHPVYHPGNYVDNWGCTWTNNLLGYEGVVVGHPLADWDAFDTYTPPDIMKYSERDVRDWKAIEEQVKEDRKKGLLVYGDGERLFDRLYFLRGFENLMIDIAEDNPKLPLLVEMLCEHEMKLVKKWIEIGVDVIFFHTDIGTQRDLMISPEQFRKYIKPMFKEIFSYVRSHDTHVYLSSDGNLLKIVDDLIECGVSMHDPQLRACTFEGIEKAYKGKMCIKLDLDRQMFSNCTPDDIWKQVKEGVDLLSDPKGGLLVYAGISDHNTPFENIVALCESFEEYCLK